MKLIDFNRAVVSAIENRERRRVRKQLEDAGLPYDYFERHVAPPEPEIDDEVARSILRSIAEDDDA